MALAKFPPLFRARPQDESGSFSLPANCILPSDVCCLPVCLPPCPQPLHVLLPACSVTFACSDRQHSAFARRCCSSTHSRGACLPPWPPRAPAADGHMPSLFCLAGGWKGCQDHMPTHPCNCLDWCWSFGGCCACSATTPAFLPCLLGLAALQERCSPTGGGSLAGLRAGLALHARTRRAHRTSGRASYFKHAGALQAPA